MKNPLVLFSLIISLFSFSVFSAETDATTVNVKDFALKLAKELNIDKDIQGDALADIVKVFPENLQAIFNDFKGVVVTRGLAADIFSYFLDANEIDSLRMAGQETDLMAPADIDALFSKSSKEGDVLTYITPPSHSFTNRLDTKLNELYQPQGATDGEYQATQTGGTENQ